MPECLLFAYAEHLPRLRAERLREAAMASAFPHMGKDGARDWLASVNKAARRISHAADSLFSLNGRPISVAGLRRRFAQAFGRGFQDE